MKKAIVAIGALYVIIGGLLIVLPYMHILKAVLELHQILGAILVLIGIGLIIYGE